MRRKDREITRIGDILKIINNSKVLHLGLFDIDFPYVVPLHYGYKFEDNRFIFYIHSAKEGHKLDLIKSNPKVCIELECNVDIISGGEIPCRYSSAYSSLIAKGTAEIIKDLSEKVEGLKLLLKNITNREFLINKNMAQSVEIIRIVSKSFTAKSNSM